ncbi:MAG: hypothetical protein NG737_07835 [Omnitrophica bacterium]|nr:hypothetical protein [Candidatus Omnitrophota bacterium]
MPTTASLSLEDLSISKLDARYVVSLGSSTQKGSELLMSLILDSTKGIALGLGKM